MAKKDIITGTWDAFYSGGSTKRVTTCINFKGYDEICQTERQNDLLGDLDNIRYKRNGDIKADLYDGRKKIAQMVLKKKYLNYSDDITYLDGRLTLDRGRDNLYMYDDDIQSGWIAKINYTIDV